jgi:hypothetical protein
MHAFCLIISHPPEIFDAVKYCGSTVPTVNSDITILEGETSVGIDVVRQATRFLATPPLGNHKVVYIPKADELSLPAMHAILKTLEEPPDYASIILCCQQSAALLPTILSRCQLVYYVPPTSQPEIPEDVANLCRLLETATPGKRLLLIAPHTTKRDKALIWCESASRYYRSCLLAAPHPAHIHNLKLLETAIIRLNANAHIALTLEYACFNLLSPQQLVILDDAANVTLK